MLDVLSNWNFSKFLMEIFVCVYFNYYFPGGTIRPWRRKAESLSEGLSCCLQLLVLKLHW